MRAILGVDGKVKRVKKPRTVTHRADGILIRELPAKSGTTYYRVEVPASVTGKRILKQFKSLAEAQAYCAFMQGQRKDQGLAAFALSESQRSIAQSCFQLLVENGLACGDLEPAVRLYLRHHRPESGNITIDTLMDLYLRGKQDGTATQGGRPLQPRSLADVENRLGVFARVFGSKWVQEVKADDLCKWLGDSTKSRQSRRNYFTVLNGMFNFAVARKYAGSNPLAGMPKPAKPGDDERTIGILTIVDASALLNAAWMHPELELGWWVTLGLFCGVRVAELQRLSVSAVDLERGFVHIGAEVAKRRRVRNIDFAIDTFEDVSVASADGTLRSERRVVRLDPVSRWLTVFPPPSNGRVCPDKFRSKWLRLLELSGWTHHDPKTWRWTFLRPWPANSARHTYASMLYELTGNAALVSSRLGHHGADAALLFEHYRGITKHGDGQRYFCLGPPASHKAPIPSVRLIVI